MTAPAFALTSGYTTQVDELSAVRQLDVHPFAVPWRFRQRFLGLLRVRRQGLVPGRRRGRGRLVLRMTRMRIGLTDDCRSREQAAGTKRKPGDDRA